jgi:cytochrome c peroxidase
MTALPEPVPSRAWRVRNAAGQLVVRNYHDAGHMLQTGRINHFGQFKNPTLWNVKNTAPYFHNNAAADLDMLLKHYQQFFTRPPIEVPGPEGQLDDGELADIKAYLLLL